MKKIEEKKIEYPAEIVFKVIFRKKSYTEIAIKNILTESGIENNIDTKNSKKDNFISYTVTGIFPSDEVLNNICSKIKTLDGYMTLF